MAAIGLTNAFDEEELVEMSMEELTDLHSLNKQMIAKLEEEHNMYRKQIKRYGPGAELAQGLNIVQRTDGTTNLEDVKKTIHDDILTMEKRLNETAKLTGISINCVEERVELTDDGWYKSINLVMQILGKEIRLKCEVDDVMSSESGTQSDGGLVSWLEVQIPNEINAVIGEAVTQVTKEAAIHLVMCLIKSYLQCVVDRDVLIRHFTQAYPDSIEHAIHGETHKLKISSRDTRHPVFIMEWASKLQDNSRYVVEVTLTVQSSEELRSKDSKGVLSSAPEMFSHMTKLMGLKKAIDRFVRMVVSEGVDILSPEEL